MSTTGSELLRYLRRLAAGRANGAGTDQQLLEQFVMRREQAPFAALLRRHGPMVLGVCRRVLGHDQDAEDAFQATFLVLARKAGSIRKHESIGSWLHGVAFHVAERLRAKNARRVTHERKAVSRPAVDPADDVAWREIRCLLDSELARLPEHYRGPLVLCYLQGKTQDEAARQLDWSVRTFRRRLKCARDLLVRRLTRRGVSLSAALSAPLLTDASAQASLPPLLADSTVRAGLASAKGNAVSGIVSAQVVALAEGGVGSLVAKKASVVVLVLLSLALGLGGLLAHRSIQDRTFPEAPAAPETAPPPQPLPTRSASKDQTIEIKGRVLDPDGKPVAGAKVYVSTYSPKDKNDPKVRAASDADGSFRFLAKRTEVDFDEMIAAVAPGYGPDWIALSEVHNDNDLTLRLVKDDVPIKGRVLDLEGRPIAGATVRVVRVGKLPSDGVAAALKELQAKPNDRNVFLRLYGRYQQLLSSVWGVLGMPKSAATGVDGRFQLRGLGRDRIAFLRIEGPGIEYRTLIAITRPDLAKWLLLGLSKWSALDLHGPTFDYVAAPSKPIRGSVREKGTGKPIAGVRVGCQALPGEVVEAFTDKHGCYEIPGIRKSEEYLFNVGHRNPPYIHYTKTVADTPGLQPVTMNFEMERGLVLRVRVTEKDTGKPVQGQIEYHIRLDNPNRSHVTTFPLGIVFQEPNEKDGTFEQVVLPGPGYITFRAAKGTYARVRLEGRDNELLLADVNSTPFLEYYHAVVPIDPSADDEQSRMCNIVLDRGRTLSGAVVDPQDRPLSETMVCGLNAVLSFASTREEEERLTTPNFTATGLDPKYPRTLIFHHARKKLAKTLVLRGDEKGPLTVRLEPLGAITGRCVDASGKPLPGITVWLLIGEKQEKVLPTEFLFLGELFRRVLPPNKATTDKDGRFRIEGLIAGLKYDLGIGPEMKIPKRVLKEVAGKPGATVEVGEIKVTADK
jgi:RNA polymerase sigma factor (sigma-70 family)